MSVPNPRPPDETPGEFNPDYIPQPRNLPGTTPPIADSPPFYSGVNTGTPSIPNLPSLAGVPPGSVIPDGNSPATLEPATLTQQLLDAYPQLEAFNSYSPQLTTQFADSINGINTAQQNIATQVATGCSICSDRAQTTVNTIMQKYVNILTNANSCISGCQSSVAQQLSAQLAQTQEGVNSTVQQTAQPYSTTVGGGDITLPPPVLQPYQTNIPILENPATPGYDFNGNPIVINIPGRLNPVETTPPPLIVTIPGGPPPTCPPPPCIQLNPYDGYVNCDTLTGEVVPEGEPPSDNNAQSIGTFVDQNTAVNAVAAAIKACPAENKKREPGYGQGVDFNPPFFTCDIGEASGSRYQTFLENIVIAENADSSIQAVLLNVIENAFGGLESLPIVSAIVGLAKQSVKLPVFVNNTVIPLVDNILGCRDPGFLAAMRTLSVLSFYEKEYGIDVTAHKKPIEYFANARCRQEHLSSDQALACYLANYINYDTYDVYCGVNNLCPDDARLIAEAGQARPIPAELLEQKFRGIITNEEYYQGMRHLGYVNPKYSQNIHDTFYEIPPVQDIIRYMVRDADDQNIVGSLGLDALFQDKFGPQLKKWSEQQGVTEQQMLYSWRSHWTIPGPQQLFEFWQRLRRNAAFGTPEQQRAKIEKALIHNDILPTWFDSYFAVQYSPLGRIDLRRAFNTGTITEKELNDGYAAIGYSDADCDRLVKFTKTLKLQTLEGSEPIKLWVSWAIDGGVCKARLNDFGLSDNEAQNIMDNQALHFINSRYVREFVSGKLPWPKVEVKLSGHGLSNEPIATIKSLTENGVVTIADLNAYERGTVTRQLARQAGIDYGISEELVDRLLLDIDDKITQAVNKVCVTSIRKQFLTGGLNEQQATGQLNGQGITAERIALLIPAWQCEQAAIGKAITASKLCDWVAKGAITAADMYSRLITLGYTADDATLLVQDCLDKANANLAKKQMREIADQAKQQAAQAKALAKAQRDMETQSKQLQTARDAAARARLNREKQLLSAAALVQKNGSCTLPLAMETVRTAKQAVMTTYGLLVDEALAVLNAAASKWKGGDCQTYNDLVDAEARLIYTEILPADAEPEVSKVSSNGDTHPSI